MEYFSNTFRFNILFNNYIMNENIKKFINVQEASKYPGLDGAKVGGLSIIYNCYFYFF